MPRRFGVAIGLDFRLYRSSGFRAALILLGFKGLKVTLNEKNLEEPGIRMAKSRTWTPRSGVSATFG